MQITVNETGAKTLKDTRPMVIGGKNVYVSIGGGTASLIVNGEIVAERAADSMTTTEAQNWAVDYRDSLLADVPTVADEDAVAEAVNPANVEWVRTVKASELRSQADAVLEDHRTNPRTGRRAFAESDPRHPVRRAESLRSQADVLADWTIEDEAGYGRYVSDGRGDSDGYHAPLDRVYWKASGGAR